MSTYVGTLSMQWSIITFHNFGRDHYLFIFNKAIESSVCHVLFSILKIIFKTLQSLMVTVLRRAFF